jgi:hypothetical protein
MFSAARIALGFCAACFGSGAKRRPSTYIRAVGAAEYRS